MLSETNQSQSFLSDTEHRFKIIHTCENIRVCRSYNQNGEEERGSDVRGGEKWRGQWDAGNREAGAGSGMGKKEVRGGCGKEQWRRENSGPRVPTNTPGDAVMAYFPLYVN